MNQSSTRFWIETITNLSILAGLIMVAVEINQNSLIARAELASDSWNRVMATDQMLLDPGFAEVYVKSLTDAEALTVPEMVQLDGYLAAQLDRIDADLFGYDTDLYEGEKLEDYGLIGFVELIGGSEFARSWWHETRHFYPIETTRMIDELLEQSKGSSTLGRYEAIKAGINTPAQKTG